MAAARLRRHNAAVIPLVLARLRALLPGAALALALPGCPASRAEPAQPAAPAAASASAPASASASAPAAASAPASAPAPASAEPRLTLSAVGDCTLGSELRDRWSPGSFHAEMTARGGDLKYPFSGVAEVLAQDDLTIANLETTLTTREPRGPVNHYVFRGDPAWARMLVEGSVEVVNVANNHSHDLGAAGFEETVRSVKAEGLGVFGFGLVDRRTVQTIEVVNLGFTGGDPRRTETEMTRAVAAHKRPENLVVVSFHWGGELVTEPNDDQRRLGRAAVDAGADLVLGHHPHVIQGIERHRGRDIVYSLGNFVFGGHSNPEDMDAIIYRATFALREGRVVQASSEALPVRISSVTERNDYRPVLLEGAEKDRVLGKLAAYSGAIGKAGEGRR